MCPSKEVRPRARGVVATTVAVVVLSCVGRPATSADAVPPNPVRARAPLPAQLPNDGERAAALSATREGNSLLDAGKPEAALEKFREAHRLVGGDKLRYNFGQALRAIPGREVEAYLEFEVFLARVPGAPPEIASAAAAERDALAKRISLLVVGTAPAAAAITVDGRLVGTTPLARAIAVKPGRHTLRVDRSGYRSIEAVVTTGVGQRMTESFTLVSVAPSAALAVPPSMPFPVAAAPPSGVALDATTASAQAEKGPASADGNRAFGSWWLWTAAAATVVVVGAIVLVARSGDDVTFACPSGVATCRSVP